MTDIYALNSVRSEARHAVASMIIDVSHKDKNKDSRVYLGLPHKEWSDFIVVRENCRCLYDGIGLGVEKNHRIFEIAKKAMPSWCWIFNMDLADAINHIVRMQSVPKVSCGWIDLMGQVGGKSYDKVLSSLSSCFDDRFSLIPMAFTWYAGRENDSSKRKLCSFAGVNWDSLHTGERHLIRAKYIVDKSSNSDWKYKPLKVLELRSNTPMKLMTGVFTRK